MKAASKKLLQLPESKLYSVRVYVTDNTDSDGDDILKVGYSEVLVLASDVEDCVKIIRASTGKNTKDVTVEIVECKLISASAKLLTMVKP